MTRVILLLVAVILSGCSLRSTYPLLGGVAGGSVGSLAGPAGGGLGAGVGIMAGEMAKGQSELAEAKETIEMLSHGDVEGIVKAKMADHASGFAEFTSYIKKILIIAGALLAIYLLIPILVARKCSKDEAKKNLTRAPFPPRYP